MKKFALSALALVVSTAAFAQQGRVHRPVPQLTQGEISIVECRDARPIFDAGYMVRVTTRPQGQGVVRVLTVAEQTFIGPRLVGQILVGEQQARPNRGGMFINYVSPAVTLSIDTTPRHQPMDLNNRVIGHPSFIRGTLGGVRFDHDLVCDFMMRAL